jgi:streptogramin lyase
MKQMKPTKTATISFAGRIAATISVQASDSMMIRTARCYPIPRGVMVLPAQGGTTTMRTSRLVIPVISGALIGILTSCGSGAPTEPQGHAISGKLDGVPSSGVVVRIEGPRYAATQADSQGRFRFDSLPGGTYRVTPFVTDHAFTPVSQTVVLQGVDVSGRDFVARTVVSGAVDEIALPSRQPGPWAVRTGPDGLVWVSEYDSNSFARLSLDGGILEFPVDRIGMSGYFANGPDAALWFSSAARVGRMDMDGGVNFVDLPDVNEWPRGITLGPDGNLWMVGFRERVMKLTPAGLVTEIPVQNTMALIDITTGPDGNLWITEHTNSWIGRMSPTGEVTTFPVTGSPSGIVVGPDGNLWFAEGEKIGRITPGGVLTEFPLPDDHSYFHDAEYITAGPDGNLWFTEHLLDKVGRITTEGAITRFDTPTSGPRGIGLGPDGRLWFAEYFGQSVGRITP